MLEWVDEYEETERKGRNIEQNRILSQAKKARDHYGNISWMEAVIFKKRKLSF